jgi:hypothetical protein
MDYKAVMIFLASRKGGRDGKREKTLDVAQKTWYSERRGNAQAKVAQLVEHSTENAGVISSILILGTFCFLGR